MNTEDNGVRLITARRYALESQTTGARQEALENVVADGFPNGCLCLVLNRVPSPGPLPPGLFYLDKESVAASDGVLAIATASGVGRWLLLCPEEQPPQ
jgi:hypothetical protein